MQVIEYIVHAHKDATTTLIPQNNWQNEILDENKEYMNSTSSGFEFADTDPCTVPKWQSEFVTAEPCCKQTEGNIIEFMQDKAYLEQGEVLERYAKQYVDDCGHYFGHARRLYIEVSKKVREFREATAAQGEGPEPKGLANQIKVEISTGGPTIPNGDSAGGLRMHNADLEKIENEEEFEKASFKDFPTVEKIDTRSRPGGRVTGDDLAKLDAEPIKEYFDVPAGAELAKFEGEAAVAGEHKDFEGEDKDSETPTEKDNERYEDEKTVDKDVVSDKAEEAPVNTTKIDVNCHEDKTQVKVEASYPVLKKVVALKDQGYQTSRSVQFNDSN